MEISEAVSDKDKEIATLKAAIGQGKSELQIAGLEERQKAKDAVQAKDAEIANLKAAAELEKSRTTLHEKSIREDYENWMKRFYEIKYDSDFANEMTRSVREFIRQMKEN